MKLTATARVELEDGVYPADLLRIEERQPEATSATQKPYLRWIFRIHDASAGPDGVELIANSSQSFGPKAKARLWMQAAMGRAIEAGEQIDPDELCPLPCQVVVVNALKCEQLLPLHMSTCPQS